MISFLQKWAEGMRAIGAKTGKGFRIPSFKLTQSNALRHPESRRNDKPGVGKAGRQYHARYGL